MWRTTAAAATFGEAKGISIHVPRVEDDTTEKGKKNQWTEFQSTSPVWRTTTPRKRWKSSKKYFNPRPPCGGRQDDPPPRREVSHFNPRPPCGGRRIGQRHSTIIKNFNPRPPCGGRLVKCGAGANCVDFNPRPPCGGRRLSRICTHRRGRFQSTSPVWRTTYRDFRNVRFRLISIHVPRVEDDRCQNNPSPPPRGFQSTSPVWRTTSSFSRA